MIEKMRGLLKFTDEDDILLRIIISITKIYAIIQKKKNNNAFKLVNKKI